MTGCSGECCSGILYVEWYGVCNLLCSRLLRRHLFTMMLCRCFMNLGVACVVIFVLGVIRVVLFYG